MTKPRTFIKLPIGAVFDRTMSAECKLTLLAHALRQRQVRTSFTDGRKSKLKARLKEAGGLEGWKFALGKIHSATWMQGANARGWRVSFDFLLTPDKFARLTEGGYDQLARRSSHG